MYVQLTIQFSIFSLFFTLLAHWIAEAPPFGNASYHVPAIAIAIRYYTIIFPTANNKLHQVDTHIESVYTYTTLDICMMRMAKAQSHIEIYLN